MNADEFDKYLISQLDEAPLPDHDFTRAVLTRIERERRQRRIVFAGAAAIAMLIAGIAAGIVPDAASAELSAQTVVAALLLITISSLAWIDGESTSVA